MIKFFRKSRQRLLAENKIRKYCFYAAGEIFLVVTGILIAIQLNNLNEDKKLDLKTEDLKNRLTQEVTENINVALSEIELAKAHVNGMTMLMHMIGKPIEQNNQIKFDSLIIYSLKDYELSINLNTLKDAKNNGEFSFIKNDTLRDVLNNFIRYENSIQELIIVANKDNNNYNLPYFYKNMNLRSQFARKDESYRNRIGYSKLEKNNYEQILMDRDFENLLTLRLLYAESMLSVYQELNGFLEYLKDFLDKEK